MVKNVPLNMSKEELAKKIEEKYFYQNLKVVYVNYCFNIEEMVELNKKIA